MDDHGDMKKKRKERKKEREEERKERKERKKGRKKRERMRGKGTTMQSRKYVLKGPAGPGELLVPSLPTCEQTRKQMFGMTLRDTRLDTRMVSYLVGCLVVDDDDQSS